jgi:hypothetical protein
MASENAQYPFTRKNWSILWVGIATIASGYAFLRIPPADGFLSLTLAPLLLIIGYCVLVPWAIMAKSQPTRIKSEKER